MKKNVFQGLLAVLALAVLLPGAFASLYDLSSASNFSTRWNGGEPTDQLTDSSQSANSIQIVNIDNGTNANDVIIVAYLADVNGKSDAGAVYLFRDVNSFSGTKDLNFTGNFSVRWNGGAASDQLGFTGSNTVGVMIVNVDNGAYANDLLIGARNADINGTANTGAVYLIKNIDSLSGPKDLNSSVNYDVRWNGGKATDQLGDSQSSGKGIQLINANNGAYANDLLFTVPFADINGIAGNGAVYLVSNIDALSGDQNLNNSSNYSARWAGGKANDTFGAPNLAVSRFGKEGVQLVNVDGQNFSNDLLISAAAADVNARTNNGALYLIRDINGVSGDKNMALSSDYTAEWHGGAGVDLLTQTGTTNLPGEQGVFLVNLDGGAFVNDLILAANLADVNGKSDNGGVYIIRNIDGSSGSFEMSSNNSDANLVFGGAAANDNLGFTNIGGQGVQLVNADNGAYSNDLILTAALADKNGSSNTGTITLIRNVDGLSGYKDLLFSSNYTVQWSGGSASDSIGSGTPGTDNTQFLNMDNGAYANDLLVLASGADVNAKTDSGGVYLIRNIDADNWTGDKNLSLTSDYNVVWNGGNAGDQLGKQLASVNSPQRMIAVVNSDNSAYANDLVLAGSNIDINDSSANRPNAGAVYLIKNVDLLSGPKDLNSSVNYDVRWSGAEPFDSLATVDGAGTALLVSSDSNRNFQLVNFDNGNYSNDLVLGAALADVNGKSDAGAVYSILNIDGLSGNYDLNTAANFLHRWNGGAASDQLGNTNGSGSSIQVFNADNGLTSNDLLMATYLADVNGLTNNGVIYLILNAVNLAPDINITRFDGNNDNAAFGYFSYVRDGNLTIDFNVQDVDSNNLTVDINYSTTNTINSGTAIATGVTLATLPTSGAWKCADTNFQNSTQCSIDWNISSTSIPSDGNYWIHITVTDGTNTDQNTSDRNVGVDNTGPTQSGPLPSANQNTGDSTPDFNIAVTDSNSGVASCTATPFVNGAWQSAAAGTVSGGRCLYTHLTSLDIRSTILVQFRTRDNADNNSSDANTAIYTIISGIPDVNITRFDGNNDNAGFGTFSMYRDGNITIDFNVQDQDSNAITLDINYSSVSTINTGTAIVTGIDLNRFPTSGPWKCDDTNFQNSTQCSVDWNISSTSIPSDGNYWIHIRISDVNGFTDQNTSDRNIGIDNNAPYISNPLPATNATTFDSTPDLNFAVTDNNTLASCTIIPFVNGVAQSQTNGTISGGRCLYTHSALGTGSTILMQGKAFDTAGNFSSDLNTGTFTIQATTPSVFITRIDGNADNNAFGYFSYARDQNLTVDFNVNDLDSNNLRVDLNYSSSSAINTGTAIAVGVDLNSLPASGAWKCSDTDFTNSTQCSIDWNISGISDGNYWLHIRVSDATDSDQNTSDRNIGIDNNAPTVLILTSGTTTSETGSITISYSGSDALSGIQNFLVSTDNVTFTDNGTASNMSFGIPNTARPFSQTYYIKAKDNAGNESAVQGISMLFVGGSSGSGSSGTGTTGPIVPIPQGPKLLESFSQDSSPNQSIPALPVVEENIQQLPSKQRRLVSSDEINVTRQLHIYSSDSRFLHEFSLVIQNISGKTFKELRILETIPKSIIAKASLITVNSGYGFDVLEEDPVLRFSTTPEMANSQIVTIQYSLIRPAPLTKEEFESIPAAIGTVQLTEEDSCLGVFCSDNNPCTLDYCQEGQCAFSAASENQTCGNGQTCQQGVCKTTAPPTGFPIQAQPQTPIQYSLFYAGLAIIALTIGIFIGQWNLHHQNKKKKQ